MRVIAGTARRLQLITLDGIDTRPTTDRIKETLFNMITPYIPGCVFLDLFSGSGGIAIEALSRGAKYAVLVENNPEAVYCIEQNLERTHLKEKATVVHGDVFTTLKRMNGQIRFDYIFMDPPYNKCLEKDALLYLAQSDLLASEGVIIVEASKETDFSYAKEMGYSTIRTKEYKTNKHVFLVDSREEVVC